MRPFIVAAILRGVSFDAARYASFIDLQDKLHQNICRKRALVAIGTHDLDTVEGPFSYEALPPEDIRFVPLKQTREFAAPELMELYKSDAKLKAFVPLIEDSCVYPVLFDSKKRVLSLPPIINGAHSAITLSTRNVLIECTATDLTKAHIVLNQVVTSFAACCAVPCSVEAVEVTDALGRVSITPDLAPREMEAELAFINRCSGLDLSAPAAASLLARMQLAATPSPDGLRLSVRVPPTRPDVLHAADVMEDVAIAFGFNSIPKAVPSTVTAGRAQPLNTLADLLRLEVAMAGFTEVLTWVLCSHADAFAAMRIADDGSRAAIVANPSAADFGVARPSLLPGVLRTLGHNKDAPLPVRLFELGDVVELVGPEHVLGVGAVNSRRLCAVSCGTKAGFEVIHGLLDRLMEVLSVRRHATEGYATEAVAPRATAPTAGALDPAGGPWLAGRAARVLYRGMDIGTFGVVHPDVCAAFDVCAPTSALEIDVEPFLRPPDRKKF